LYLEAEEGSDVVDGGVEGYCSVDLPNWPIENSKMCPNGADVDIIWDMNMSFMVPIDNLEITI